ncbi:28S ribosomal protein S34, mitochondrial-like [Argonauta hians]
MRVIRLVGKVNLDWSGKPLYRLVSNLKNNGVGRVVARHSFYNRYPEKSYYRLTKVEPYFRDPARRSGKAWGIKVFRGKEFPNVREITAGHKADWKLIPKEEEEEFCKLSEKDVRETRSVPLTEELPPLLKAMVIADKKRKGETVPENLLLNLAIHRNEFSTKVTQCN